MIPFSCCLDDEVEVRPISLVDAQDVFHMLDENRPAFERAFPRLNTMSSKGDVAEFIHQVKQQAHEECGLWCLILRADEVIGLIALTHLDWLNSQGILGYALTPSHQGKGILTRAIRAMLNYCFGELALHRMEVCVEVSNPRGRAVPERLGFTMEGLRKEAYATREGYSDLAAYRMLESEWRNQSS